MSEKERDIMDLGGDYPAENQPVKAERPVVNGDGESFFLDRFLEGDKPEEASEPEGPVAEPIAIVNGRPQRHISVLDRGLSYGDGIFETMIAVNGDIPCWRFHYDRLCRGLQALAIPLDNQILARQMRAVLASGMLVGEKVSACLLYTSDAADD